MWTLLLPTTLFTLLLLFPSSAAGATTCSSSQISCDGICAVPCDGIVECTNREDETSELCQGTKCSNGPSLTMGELGDLGDIFSQAESNAGVEFQCDYGGCIPVFFACNGGINCWDGSDETQEACTAKTCNKRYHQCDYGGCIRERWICNGLKNCADGSDETAALCKNKACGSKFKCDYGGCIDPRKKCNGIVDCNDSSDETKELCGPNHIVQGASPSTSTPTLPVTQPPPPVTQPPPPVTQPQPVTRPLSGTPGVIFPVVTETSTDQCSHSGRCACPAPNNHFCAPCGDLSACDRINEVGVCSTEIIGRWDTKVSIDVLSCGVQPILNVVGISRNQGEVSCGLNNKVPVLSVVTAECWGTTVLAECRADGLWHAYGGIHNSTVPSRYLCQPQEVNSPLCGKRPIFYRRSDLIIRTGREPYWPWLVALEREHQYSCTGTLINPRYIITAAHCLTRTQEAAPNAIDVRDLRVNLVNEEGLYVSEIHLYPNYAGGNIPVDDLALVKLESEIVFSKDIYPACVSPHPLPRDKLAATFSRDSNRRHWKLVLQQRDARCHLPFDRCSTSLQITSRQFCGIDVESQSFLPEGSSGGPYLVNLGTAAQEQWSVAGIVSRSRTENGCSNPYTIFTATTHFYSWIAKCVHTGVCTWLQ